MIDAGTTIGAAVVALAVLGVVLFAIAIRAGHWAVWVAGYAALLLALGLALGLAPRDAQPSGASGVPHTADRVLDSDEAT
jgi:hypothetical protein